LSGGAATAVNPSAWTQYPVGAWLAEHGGQRLDLGQLIGGLCDRLLAERVPLWRVVVGVNSIHPEVAARSVVWERGKQGVVRRDFSYSMRDADTYVQSPVRLIHEGAGAIRRRLEGPDAQLDFPVLKELAGKGATDYVIMPILYTTGRINFISWTSDRPGGFSKANLTLLYDLLPLISLRVEIAAGLDNIATMLNVYLGREPAKRVMAGTVRRGEVETIRAAVWVSDLRNFTSLSDRLPAPEVVRLLDTYFELAARPIEDGKGEILKFIGDGILAIFPVDGDERVACRTALDAATALLDALDAENARRREEDRPDIRCGVGLHLGDVQYGNIGARERLDFTVIGRAVNEASRVEALCKVLGRRMLATGAFARAVGLNSLVSCGVHALRGVREPQEIFGLRE